jgi:hypothetical protein
MLEFAEITSEVPTVLPYLGPEIIAVMQAAGNALPDNSPSGPGLPTPSKIDGRSTPLIVTGDDIVVIHLCLNVRFWTGSFGILRDERYEPTDNWNIC